MTSNPEGKGILDVGNEISKVINEILDDVRNDGRKNSELLSERARIVSLSVIGLCWSFIIANLTKSPQSGAGLVSTKSLLCPLFLSLFALLSDFLQYVLCQVSINYRLSRIPKVYNAQMLEDLYTYLRSGSRPRLSKMLDNAAQVVYTLKIISTILAVIIFARIFIEAI